MTPFYLTEAAFRDIDLILAFLVDEAGMDAAYDVRALLFEAFRHLTEFPGLGHRRPDLTRRDVVFYLVSPYLIVFDRKSDPLTIHAVLHSARDVKGILRKRPVPQNP